MASLDDLKNVLRETLEQKGTLNKVKAEIRAEICTARDADNTRGAADLEDIGAGLTRDGVAHRVGGAVSIRGSGSHTHRVVRGGALRDGVSRAVCVFIIAICIVNRRIVNLVSSNNFIDSIIIFISHRHHVIAAGIYVAVVLDIAAVLHGCRCRCWPVAIAACCCRQCCCLSPSML